MKTNDLKKGMRVKLRNGWEAEIADNAKGDRRMAKVYGFHTDLGSVYSHDIVYVQGEDTQRRQVWLPIEHTPKQLKLKATVAAFGF